MTPKKQQLKDYYDTVIETVVATREETKALAEASKPKVTSFETCADADGVIKIILPQTENQVDLLKISL